MSVYQSMTAGLPMNYITNPMYLYYMQMLQQQAQYAQQQAKVFAEQQAVAAANAKQSIQAQNYEPVDTVETQYKQQPQIPQVQTEDGKDDGKISFWSKAKNLGKGAVNFFKNMVCDENGFSITRTLKTAAIAAGAVALTVATGGAAAPFLVAGGALLGGVEVAKGAYRAYNAETDAEAELAWQQIGSGATGVALSVAGAKGALKSSGVDVSAAKYAGIKGSFRATAECVQTATKGSYNGARFAVAHPMQSVRNLQSYYKNTVKPNWEQSFSFKNASANGTEHSQSNINQSQVQLQKYNQSTRDLALLTKDYFARVNEKINNINESISSDKILAKAKNISDVAQKTLADTGMAVGSVYLTTETAVENLKKEVASAMEQQYYAQQAEQAQAEVQAIDPQQNDEQQQYQTKQQEQLQQNYINPYAQFMMNYQFPQSTGLDFNALYVNPYPDFIY